jgi:CheY-like chemotaxis protein
MKDTSKAHRPLEGVRVLLVEDDPDTREMEALALRDAGAAVHATESAASALAHATGGELDVVVCDLGLPDVDGLELLRRLRSQGGRSASVPALAVTAWSDEEHVEQAADAGFHAHVVKPLEPRDLVVAVAFLVGVPATRGR